MSTLMAAQMGMSLVQGVGQFASASIQADLQKRMQEYRNTMGRLSAARSTNALTINEVGAEDAATRNKLAIQKIAMQDQGSAEVQAAAAGVAGNSVEMTMTDLRASAGMASYAQTRQLRQKQAQVREDKSTVAIQAITGQDVSVIPKPSIGSALLGMGTNLLSIYDSHQPEGDRLLGSNGGRVNDMNRL